MWELSSKYIELCEGCLVYDCGGMSTVVGIC